MYLLRLDDASEYMDVKKWSKIEGLLNKYSIKPIVGIIPNNQDENFVNTYSYNANFWEWARAWQCSGWTIALHGLTHVYATNYGGINPVNLRSEFAGLSLNKQINKISQGIKIFEKKGLVPKLFYAPSHTFDLNTIKALKKASEIRVISDTIANDIYKMSNFFFIPQQSGKARRLPFKATTFCYHPNSMTQLDYDQLDKFLQKHHENFVSFNNLSFTDRQASIYDHLLHKAYYLLRSIRDKFPVG